MADLCLKCPVISVLFPHNCSRYTVGAIAQSKSIYEYGDIIDNSDYYCHLQMTRNTTKPMSPRSTRPRIQLGLNKYRRWVVCAFVLQMMVLVGCWSVGYWSHEERTRQGRISRRLVIHAKIRGLGAINLMVYGKVWAYFCGPIMRRCDRWWHN